MIEPKEITIVSGDGTEYTFTIHKFPAIEGREIVCKYPISAIPKVGDYSANEETMIKLMAYVGVNTGDQLIMLKTKALINNHVPDWEILAKIEMAVMEYNVSFFAKGRSWISSGTLKAKALALTSEILTALSELSSPKEKPRSKK
ncbi:hypothetical protein LPW36_01955 [Jinshanibacter sp. LJY008]|uniref:Phage protein n=1 Tax=Limnobaculum eriocheiris TaxID=2897391 RepID=A0A9X1MUE1_9GAMM|nr:hypothetical protein [Limnobaculum eriocheiris]MCD1124808.1 hypothetical protein [Limnobaculum eriocheiris]